MISNRSRKRVMIFIGYSLYPFSFLWSWIYRIRRFFYTYGFLKRRSFHVPIISVGNLTFGGTGKTPFTLWLSEFLNEREKSVMILMRGYKGNLENSFGILHSDRRLGFNPFDYGDEALLLARRLDNASIVVGKKRASNLEYYFEYEKPDIVLLDDGHQHIQLERNLNIVLFDSLMPIERYKVAPQGYLREGLTALKDADLVVLGRCDQATTEKINELKNFLVPYLNPGIPFAQIKYSPSGFFDTSYKLKWNLEDIQGRRVICVAGVASPESFFNLVESLGADVIDQVSFPDHHFFSVDEIRVLLDKAAGLNATIITTEKDIVKIKRIVDDRNILYLEIKIDFISGEEETKAIISEAVDL